MPGVSGLDLLKLLRGRAIELPAILVTTEPSGEMRNRAAQAGAGIVEKPLTDDALLEAIQAALAPSA
jgi:FixJ family two-component response regulator